MSLTYASRSTKPFFWCAGLIFSAALHIGLPSQILSNSVAETETTELQPDGITGAIMFDLSDIIAAPSALQEDTIAQEEAVKAPTVTESPEAVEAAKAAEQPLLAQIPYDVKDESLKFAVAAPETEAETEEVAEEVATEHEPEQIEAESQIGAEDQQASQQSASDVDTETEAETAKAESEGLTAEQTEEIHAWQKSIVLLISGAKTYPAKARSDRIEGEVRVKFTLDRYGALLSTELAESSGSAVLDDAAIQTVEQLRKMPTPPNYLSGNEFTLIIPLRYSFK